MVTISGFMQASKLQDYQDWLRSVGIYTKASWGLNKHKKALPLFTEITSTIDLVEGTVTYVKTNNEFIHASIDDVFDGTIVDALNMCIIEYKESIK